MEDRINALEREVDFLKDRLKSQKIWLYVVTAALGFIIGCLMR